MSPLGGHGSISRPIAVAVTPGFLLDSGLPQAAGAYALRRLRTAYTANKAIRVQRTSDSTQTDIGFDSSGGLDTTSLATFCLGTTGLIAIWYDQSGNGRNLVQATAANMYQIYSAGAVESLNSKSAAKATDASRGMVTAAFTAYTGTAVTTAIVGAISSSTASVSPRYASLIPSGLADNAAAGASVPVRNGGSPATEQWSIGRADALRVTVGGTYGRLQQIMSAITDASISLTVDGAPASATAQLGAFNVTRLGASHTGSAPASSTTQYIAEMIVWFSTLSTSQNTAVSSDQATRYGTSGTGSGTTTLLLDAANVPAAAASWSTRRLKASYTGPLLRVQRASDNTETDIGYLAISNELDTAAIATFCGSSIGYVTKFYDQSGNGRDLIETTQANMWRIYDGVAVYKRNGRAALTSLDQARGMATALFTAYVGTALSGSVVGVMPSAVTALSPHYLTAIPTLGIADDNAGSRLISRHGGGTPDQKWGTLRNNVFINTADGKYDQLQLVTVVIADPSYSISVDSNNASVVSASDGAFNFTRLGLGFGGSTFYQSAPGQYITESIVWFSALTSVQKTAVETHQRAWFSTATPVGGSGGGGTGADKDLPTDGWRVIYDESFSQGYAHNWTGVNVTSGMNPAHWGEYGPGPGNEGVGTRTPANIVVVDGECQFRVYSQQGTCAGVSGYPHTLKYGRWSIKFRQEKGKGAGLAILLWPGSGRWPDSGEIDIVESPEGDATRLHTTLHIGSDNRQTGQTLVTDLTQWHVLTTIWEPSYIAFALDGVEYYRNTDPSFQPPNAMWMAIQNDLGAAGHWIGAPNASTPQPVTLHVDWVRIYQR